MNSLIKPIKLSGILSWDQCISSITSNYRDKFFKGYGSSVALINKNNESIEELYNLVVSKIMDKVYSSFGLDASYYSISCTGSKKLVLIRIHNTIGVDLNIEELSIHENLDDDDIYDKLEKLIFKKEEDIIILFRNAENLEEKEWDEISGMLTSYGVHLAFVSNREFLLQSTGTLSNINLIIHVKDPSTRELQLMYIDKAAQFCLNPPEGFELSLISLQNKCGISHRMFGIDIFNRIHEIQDNGRNPGFWDYLNVAIEYAQSELAGHELERLESILKNSELKKIILDNLCSLFKSKPRCFITYEDFIEILDCSAEAVESFDQELNLEEVISFLEEIGLLYRIVKAPNVSRALLGKFFLGWTQYTIIFIQELLLKKKNIKKEEINLDIPGSKNTLNSQVGQIIKKAVINIKDLIRKDNIQKIAEDSGIPSEDIYKMAREKKDIGYDFITEEVGLYLVTHRLKKKAPLCKYTRNDKSRCQKRTRDPSGFCHHHKRNM